MGVFVGSITGAVALMIIGRMIKGRDFLGFAAFMAVAAIAIGVLLSPSLKLKFAQVYASDATLDVSLAPVAFGSFMGVATCLFVIVVGGIFVAASKPASKA